jgi:hypothetical protein
MVVVVVVVVVVIIIIIIIYQVATAKVEMEESSNIASILLSFSQ